MMIKRNTFEDWILDRKTARISDGIQFATKRAVFPIAISQRRTATSQ